jgi:hypothetical protein
MNAIERLQKWKSQHKSRWCQIGIDDGYGVSEWSVMLADRNRKLEVSELAVAKALGLADWAGLENTLNHALDEWEQ